MISLKNHSIFTFSDTHGNHRSLQVPEKADIIICAGDAVEDEFMGGEYDDFIEWFSSLTAKWKIFVPGNHELSFELGLSEHIEKKMSDKGIIVSNDSVIDCDGIIIASISGHRFVEDYDIPTNIDILVTHYPPFGVLDEGMGSTEILNFLSKYKPKWHFFGHVHSTAGQSYQLGNTNCYNVGIFNE